MPFLHSLFCFVGLLRNFFSISSLLVVQSSSGNLLMLARDTFPTVFQNYRIRMMVLQKPAPHDLQTQIEMKAPFQNSRPPPDGVEGKTGATALGGGDTPSHRPQGGLHDHQQHQHPKPQPPTRDEQQEGQEQEEEQQQQQQQNASAFIAAFLLDAASVTVPTRNDHDSCHGNKEKSRKKRRRQQQQKRQQRSTLQSQSKTGKNADDDKIKSETILATPKSNREERISRSTVVCQLAVGLVWLGVSTNL